MRFAREEYGLVPILEDMTNKHGSLLRDSPDIHRKVANVTRATFYLASRLEEEADLECFAARVAEALRLDGVMVSTDSAFDQIENLARI